MKRDRKSVEERQARILELVQQKEQMRVEDLARIFQVSPMTIRRDLNVLSTGGALSRLHGSAVTNDSLIRADHSINTGSENPLILRCRKSISKYAAGFVSPGERLFINGSRTALDLLHYLDGKEVSVYTNNGWAVMDEWPPEAHIHLIGGELCQRIMIGETVVQSLLQMSADKTFIGCGAVYEDGEFRYDIPTEIAINEMMISRTKGDFYILADHTKMRKRADQVNVYGSFRYHRKVTLITDELTDADLIEKLQSYGITVLQAPIVF